MKKIGVSILLTVILISCGTENKKSVVLPNVSYNPKGELEYGTLDSAVYHNNYFGFSFSCPIDKWVVLNTEQYAHRLASNKEDLNASDKSWKQTTSNLHNLLTIEKRLIDSIEQRHQSISFTAEGLEVMPNINSSIEYFKYTEKFCKENYSSNYPKYTMTTIDTALIGNKTFLVATMTIEDSPAKERFQKTYSAKFDKYLLNILVNYYTEQEQKENEKILKEVKWD